MIAKTDIYRNLIKLQSPNINIIKPNELKKMLDEYIIGMDQTKKVLSTAIYNHYKRILINSGDDDIEIDKSNILLLGGTGTGKTYIIKTIAKFLNVPCYIADCSTLTESGYVGSDIETVLVGALEAANSNLKEAEMSIICLDEFDKIARKGESLSITRDVSGEGVQQGLLKLMEDNIVEIQPGEKRKHPDKPTIGFNTRNILFICGGSFEGIEDKIKRRLGSNKIGYNTQLEKKDIDENNILKYVTTEDLKSFGIIPEMIGRLPIITNTETLTEDALVRILTEPKNAIIKQYKQLFKMDGVELLFNKESLLGIAKHAIKMKTGARSLRSICETVLQDYMYSIHENDIKEIIITKEHVEEKLKSLT